MNRLCAKLGADVIDGKLTLAQAQAQLTRQIVTKGAAAHPPAAPHVPAWTMPGWAWHAGEPD